MNKINITHKNFYLKLLLCVLFMFCTLVISFMLGAENYRFIDVLRALIAYDNSETHNIIREIRMPREVAAMLVGMALACSGAMMQGVTRNPLADPALIGINAGALLSISIVFACIPDVRFIVIMIAGFIGAILGGTLVLVLGSTKRGGFNTMKIILAGAAVSTLLTAIAQGISIYFQTNQSNLLWTSGGVTGTTWEHIQYAAPVIFMTLLITFIFSRQLTVLNIGDEMASGLGVNISRARLIFSMLTMILAGIAVALAGSLAFVGLMIPHIARMLVGVDYRRLLPFTTILGGIFVVWADIIARKLGESPVGAIVSIIGVPFFIYLVRKGGKL
ncbi:FecCD family ABC transporter permease [Macrococcus armenti]|uniref:FecCD family ABC transporter permease n=1 Tax=Macrococcus armenti TaxID=2875764 RepID=UPI001CCF0082|nr:iron ABC transporter permease [Macrococcus armenti]UBH08763.1 iron ABC transporter permease [Macrococcus armenti]UBH11060.1 iron ABC transporter permease [Macrococcus armenti]UBH15539.1 iron ABC transporter permease [Macrococcus armenti]UBH17900.1 iron ABC transporter permease [Macrococcus armenti]UBH20165.1 iron ABC transporter permease [Macrococcus armenti]